MNLDKHIWLINLIAQHPKGITLKEINDAVNKTTIKIPSPLNRMTMLRYRDTIFQQFGVNISCASHAHYSTYFISNPEVLSNNTMEGWVCRNFMTNNLMAGSMSLKDRILPEAIPSNGSQLQQLLDAMANSAIITFTYKKYDGSTSHRQAEPYCVKLWNQRWYLLGHNATTLNDEDSDVVHVRKFAIFSLDRISDVSLLKRNMEKL